MKNKEIILKMSLETARKIYKEVKDINNILSFSLDSLYKIVIENFTKEELEGNKGYTWEESFKPGYYFSEHRKRDKYIDKAFNTIPQPHFINQFRTEKQALSALAFAQLSHIIAKYNENIHCNGMYYGIGVSKYGLEIYQTDFCKGIDLFFYRKEDADRSLLTNNELWNQYLNI